MGQTGRPREPGRPEKKRRRESEEGLQAPPSKRYSNDHAPSTSTCESPREEKDRTVVPEYIHGAPNVEQQLTALPPLHDQKLLSAVFTHRGSLGANDSLDLDQCYDRYEFLGDAYLEVISTRILFNTFPNLQSGRLATFREALINNTTLGNFAVKYGFDRKVTIPEQALVQNKNPLKVYADVFEAYVAAVILQSPTDGFRTAEVWLRNLWAPQFKNFQQSFATNNSVASGQAKQELAKKVLGKGIKIEYVEQRKPEPAGQGRSYYFVGAFLTGWGWENECLGSGMANSKALAGSQAALDALQNRPLIDEIAAVKQAFDAETRLEKLQKESEEVVNNGSLQPRD
ncbi:MAG: hypothetical protein M4579_002374 [Chaenotheca gracillima]|nr:MAG: hypothetical protein M4579_002374 [Chaenotheca gracillima]